MLQSLQLVQGLLCALTGEHIVNSRIASLNFQDGFSWSQQPTRRPLLWVNRAVDKVKHARLAAGSDETSPPQRACTKSCHMLPMLFDFIHVRYRHQTLKTATGSTQSETVPVAIRSKGSNHLLF
jgi:hypothetical protein